MTLFTDLKQSFKCKCPRCHEGALYKPGLLNFTLNDSCSVCQLDLSKNDSADGPAVFLIFILGFSVVPLALIVDLMFHPPVWLEMMFWTPLCFVIILGTLKPLKSFVIALQWKHRASDWSK